MASSGLGAVLNHLRRSTFCEGAASVSDGELLEDFIGRRDERAFEELVRRHGAMVLGVCRRVLRSEADAEDAFQATFLVLVRKAASIRPRGMVGNWLYGVAHSTALKARSMNNKRRTKERAAAARLKPDTAADTWEHLHALLDQELKVLPDKYRGPMVLCDLEGKSIKEAARQLGCPQGTLGTRLARGRGLLARRLARHRLTLSAGMIGALLAQTAATAGVPPLLMNSTVKAATLIAAGQAAAPGVISAKVAALTNGVLKAMLITKLKGATAAILTMVVMGLAAWGAALATARADPTPARQAAQPTAPTEKAPDAQARQDARPAAQGTDQGNKKTAEGDDEPITAMWITEKQVQHELRLTEAQVKKIEAVRSAVYRKHEAELKEAREEAKKHKYARAMEVQRKVQAEERKALTEAATQILSAGALRRLRQIQRQARGLHNLIQDHAVQKKLNLNDEQLKQIEGFLKEGLAQARKDARKLGGEPGAAPIRIVDLVAREQKAYAPAMKSILGVFTDEQRRLWNELVGKPFGFEAGQSK